MFEIICWVVLLADLIAVLLVVMMFANKKSSGRKIKSIDKMRKSLFVEEEALEDYGYRMGYESFGKDNIIDWSSLDEGDTFTMDNKKYEVLLIFKGNEDKERYIVYTDNSTDADGKLQLFALKYNYETSVKEFLSVDNEEWSMIKNLLDYAMEKSIEPCKKAENKIECPEGEFSAFHTFCYLANAIAQDEGGKTPFILATKGEDGCDEFCGVILSGTNEDVEDAFKHIVISLGRKYKAEGVAQHKAFDNLLDVLVGALNEGYKSRFRQEVENIFLGDTEEIDIKDYLDDE